MVRLTRVLKKQREMKWIVTLLGMVTFLSSFCQEDIKPIIKDSKPYSEEVYQVVDKEPRFKGGEKGLIKYYQENSSVSVVDKNQDALSIYYQIVIDEYGKPTNFKILRGQSELLNNEVEKLVQKMPKWKPGKLKGKPVKVVRSLEVRFSKR